MVEQGTQGKWHDLADRLLHRGLISDFLNNPNSVISEVLSPPAATTQDTAKAENTPAPTTAAAAAAPVTTQPAAAAPAASTQQAQQPATSPASSPKPAEQPTSAPAAQAPTTTTSSTPPAAAQPTTAVAADPAAASKVSSAPAVVTSSAPGVPAAASPAPVDPASSMASSKSAAASQATSVAGKGVGVTASSSVSASSQRPTVPMDQSQSEGGRVDQTPLVATGVILGIVVFMGISLLLFWCYRRRRKANKHHHEALAPQGPVDDENLASGPRLRNIDDPENLLMTEPRAVSSGQDYLAVQHPQPPPSAASHARHGSRDSAPDEQDQQPRTNPFAGQPSFTYAQAQQYAQSHGAFSYPAPPIPDSSPIRIFRWPTRSSRSGSSPSIFSALRSSKAASRNSRAMSRASRSTVSSMLWHGRRDVARRTLVPAPPQTPSSQRAGNGNGNGNGSGNGNGFLSATPNTGAGTGTGESPMPSPMPDGLHTPILDWLHWIRGHQSDGGGDPESNHRKSIASLTESAVSEGSIASSGVLSPTLLSWPQQDGNTTTTTTTTRVSVMRARGLTFVPILPPGKRQSSNGDTLVDQSAYRLYG
ncbi:hypothetical protein Cob_v010279 [Colletotrichum orbiculare MAFF 240422]|uniref:Uncharacterized protein n=1 Tax=Colletotrichum orbiculare (strain 104-T / ATCC 96160 / CBS 514.97 / LARS 414 / MAFF 240422) TaxID=1213857 RepID=A0A484FH00_COLOR|nr:hypothetical protein Cob_v010279 [Colletotrichum orbiculare MAFF 240422]